MDGEIEALTFLAVHGEALLLAPVLMTHLRTVRQSRFLPGLGAEHRRLLPTMQLSACSAHDSLDEAQSAAM